ncbi:MAG: hypothetical protein ABII82_21000 [Verrucomicrobiota bacterium]
MKLASKRFVPEILLALSFVMCVVLGALCYWHAGRLLGLRSGEDRRVSVNVVATLATVFAVLPISVCIRHWLKKVHNSERKDADESAPQLSFQMRDSFATLNTGLRTRN